MKLIAAVDNKWNIGNNGGLLFSIPTDMKFFRETTSGKVVVMGRKTLDSFPGGKALKNRVNIVLTRDPDFARENVTVRSGVEQTLELLRQYDSDDVYIIGGESVYKAFLPYCDCALITHVDTVAPKADKTFPDLSKLDEWSLSQSSECIEENGLSFKFCTYVKSK